MSASQIIPVAGEAIRFIWPLLSDWILKKDEEGARKTRFARFLKFIDMKNLRQALFEREKKAQSKYGTGLSLDTDLPAIQVSVEKLSDSVYFLFKTLHDAEALYKQNPNEYQRQLDILSDLHTVLGTFIVDLKNVKLHSVK